MVLFQLLLDILSVEFPKDTRYPNYTIAFAF